MPSRGLALLWHELYLPEDWSNDRPRCRTAGGPDEVLFQTKPALARAMLRRAYQAGVQPEWTVGDAVYGSAPALRADLQAGRWAYGRGIRSTEPVRPASDSGLLERPAGALAAALPEQAWRRLSAGEGTPGARLYDWARGPLVHLATPPGSHALLVRRALEDPRDGALFLVFTTRATALAEMVRAAGQRWRIETGFEAAKGEGGLGHYEVRLWEAGYRHIPLALLAYAFLAVIRARAAPAGKKILQLIPRTRAEIRRLLGRGALTVVHSLEHILHWSYWRRWHQAVAAAGHARRKLASAVKLRL